MNSFKKIINLIIIKKDFLPPKQSKILVIDKNFDFILKKFFKKKLEFLDIRLKEINLFVLLKLFFSSKKKTFFNYVIEYIKLVKCTRIITFNDNLIWFYKLKKKFPKKKFISVQNGFRTKTFFTNLVKEQPLAADIVCTFNKSFGDQFKEKINTKILVLGSLKNNFNKIKPTKIKRNSILLISSGYPDKEFFQSYNKIDFKYLSSEFYNFDKIILRKVVEFCKKKKIKLEIAAKNGDDINEYFFFKKNIKNFNFIYHRNNYKNMKTYEIADQVIMSVCSHSTFGYENLARGNKTIIFNNKKKFTKGIWDVFWHLNFSQKGLFWTDSLKGKQINNLLNSVYFMKDKLWLKKTKHIVKKIMYYDKKDKKINYLKKILQTK